MGPLFFNIYAPVLQSTVTNRCHQYAVDTTLYAHAKPIQLDECISSIKSDLIKLKHWAGKCNLAINPIIQLRLNVWQFLQNRCRLLIHWIFSNLTLALMVHQSNEFQQRNY